MFIKCIIRVSELNMMPGNTSNHNMHRGRNMLVRRRGLRRAGVQAGEARGRGGRVQSRLLSRDGIHIGMKGELQVGDPLETPLYAKKRKTQAEDQDDFHHSEYAECEITSTSRTTLLIDQAKMGSSSIKQCRDTNLDELYIYFDLLMAMGVIVKSNLVDYWSSDKSSIVRQLVSEQISNLKNADMRVGQVYGCTSGDVDLLVWRDQNRVALISTYHGSTEYENKPTLVQENNICMGDVGKKDPVLSSYPIERKRTQVWYKKFLRRLLNVSVLNAYILL